MNCERACITNVQRCSLDDGPGIRTTVFFKSCNLNCRWCHNPETISRAPQLQYVKRECIGCSACVDICVHGAHRMDGVEHVFDRGKCRLCFACEKVCPSGALSKVGQDWQLEELLRTLLLDKAFFSRSGGGVTLSGGEPLLQPDFCALLLRALHTEGIHTCVDTAGHLPWETFERILNDVNLILFDIKAMDDGLHRMLTGVGNEQILTNFLRLTETNTPLWVRIPLVADVNDTAREIDSIITLLEGRKSVLRVELLPYHRMGAGKYDALGMRFDDSLQKPMNEKMLSIQNQMRAKDIPCEITLIEIDVLKSAN